MTIFNNFAQNFCIKQSIHTKLKHKQHEKGTSASDGSSPHGHACRSKEKRQEKEGQGKD
jgi:hypothetical protein